MEEELTKFADGLDLGKRKKLRLAPSSGYSKLVVAGAIF